MRILTALIFISSSLGISAHRKPLPKSLDEWVEWSRPIAVQKMVHNISPAGTAKGVVVASPSKNNPDYFFHWIRDAALVMDVVVSLYARAEGEQKNYYRNRLLDFVDLSIRNQRTPNKSGGVGEPKFLASGDPFDGEWGRPQDDGPALRALTLIHWARVLMLEGNSWIVLQKLYNGWDSVIKTDLEYVSHHWQNTCYDLWEEIRGHHFFTRMVQRKALLEGADLASRLGDGGAAFWYREQARYLSGEILKHWNGSILASSLNQDGGIDYKHSNLDSSIVLGMIHGYTHDGFLAISDDRVMATVHRMEIEFEKLYAINQVGHRGIAAGRYPEDRYNGYWSGGDGNPWFISTNAIAQYYFLLSRELKKLRSLKVSHLNRPWVRSAWPHRMIPDVLNGNDLQELAKWAKLRGDDYLSCSQFHMGEDGSLSEQFNRITGFMQGAHDLTWSYASLLTAFFNRF